MFVRVGESGSFTRAAHDMNLSQPSVSRIIGELEARLGVKLLLRTTRRLTLTAAGEKFLARARDVLADLDEAEDAARGVDSLRGTLRVALPVVFGMREVIPRLPEFLARHPLLRVELRVSDAYQDLVAEGVDVAIRLGRLADSTFGARRLATLPRFVVASPAYLKTRGIPRSPAELAKHDCIFGPNGLGRESWTFKRRNTVISVDVTGRIYTHSGPALCASAVAGLGGSISSDGDADPAALFGAVVRLHRGGTSHSAARVRGPRPAQRCGRIRWAAAAR